MNRRIARESGPERSRAREVLGILLVLCSIFLVVALVSYDPVDWPNSSRAYTQKVENIGGKIGALVSWFMMTAFGFTSYALAALLAVVALVMFLHRSFRLVVRPAALLLVFGLFGPMLAALVMNSGSTAQVTVPAYEYGGVVGGLTADALISWFGTVGAYLTAIAAMLVTLVLATTITLSAIVEGIAGLFHRNPKRESPKRKGAREVAVEDDYDLEADEEPIDAEDEDPFLTPLEAGEEEDMRPARKRPLRPTIVESVPAAAKGLRDVSATAKDITDEKPHAYVLPGPELLDRLPDDAPSETKEEMIEKAEKIVECLRYFNIESEVRQITPGPIVTRYELTLAPGVKVGKVVNLSDDLAMALKARGGIRILAPIPGKAAIGIEVPNRTRSMVSFREIVESEAFLSVDQPLVLALGKSTSGETAVADLEKMPHLLIAGSTGSGKSVCINTLIGSILMKASPDRVRMILVDPKVVELSIYNAIPHLLTPVITDPKRAGEALQWAVREMERRYRLLASQGVRDIGQFNRKIAMSGGGPPHEDGGEELLPYIVVIIDEFADLMMIAANEIEESIARLAQMARAVGIHLVLATQRPSADVITGLIKANFPSRIAFKVMQAANSRIILDQNGADKLLGMGDMLFLQAGKAEAVRLHGAYISGEESQRLVDFVTGQGAGGYERITDEMFAPAGEEDDGEIVPGMRDPNARDPLFWDAARMVVRHNQGSVSLLQRRLKIGYARAARLIDQLESAGIVSPYDGSKAREVMVDDRYLDDMEAEGL